MSTERLRDDPEGTATPLIIAGVGERFISQRTVQYVLNHIADTANKGRDVADRIVVHPHRLRHTFGAEFRARSGSDTETAAALGHTGLRYVGRYVRQSQQEREAALEETFLSELAPATKTVDFSPGHSPSVAPFRHRTPSQACSHRG